MSDTTRGLIIGVGVGIVGGMLVGGVIVGLVSEYAPVSAFNTFISNYGIILGTVSGALLGPIGAYRMLQNMEREREERS